MKVDAAPPEPSEHPPELRFFGWGVLMDNGKHALIPRDEVSGTREAMQIAAELGGEIFTVYRWAHVSNRAPAAECPTEGQHER